MKSTNSLLIHVLIIISISITITHASLFLNSLFNLAKRPLMNAYATNSGTVPLFRDDLGFYASVDLAEHSSDASDTSSSPDTVNVMLGLYTPTTALITNCLSFSGYSCYYPRCNSFSWTNVSTNFLY